MSRQRWILVLTIMLVAVASTGMILARDSGESSTPTVSTQTGLDPNYDDRWVENIPDTIGGLPVLFVTTPKNQACSYIPIVHLGTPQASIKELLDKVDGGSILQKVRAIKGVPANVTVSFGGPSASAEMMRSNIEEWNATKAAQGCDASWGPMRYELDQP